MKSLTNIFRNRRSQEPVIVVSGLPRSGTSLMMNILKAGGVELVTDNIRQSDEDNPLGYFELEAVKLLGEGRVDWLAQSPGKVVKIITAQLQHLPDQYEYKIIVMQRLISEVLASQRAMMARNNKNIESQNEAKLGENYKQHLLKVYQWMERQRNVDFIRINYNQLLSNPTTSIEKVTHFLGKTMDGEAMIRAIDPTLHRQRIS